MDIPRRIEALSAEIRGYPTPIARCDEQLTALIEERAELIAKLGALQARSGCCPEALWANDGGAAA
jgi:chorismate mutase